MCNQDDEIESEATEEQLAQLRSLGIRELDLEGLSFADAEDWIADLRALREGRDEDRS